MRKATLVLALLFSLGAISAQSIEEDQTIMSQGNQNALYVFFSDAKAKDVEDLWVKFARDLKGKTQKVKKSDEFLTDDASLPNMSANTVDIYALANQESRGVRFFLWFDLGGAYLSARQHPDRIDAGRELMREFSRYVQAGRLEDLVKEQASQIKKLEKELAGAEKGVKKATEALREAERAEKAVRDAIREQEQKLGEYEAEIKRLKKGR